MVSGVDDEDVLAEAAERDQAAVPVDEERPAVEHQRVVGACHVAVRDRDRSRRGEVGAEADAQGKLVHLVGGCRRHDDEAGAGVQQFPRRIDGIAHAGDRDRLPPQVLADREAYALAAVIPHAALRGRLEVPGFVEDVVGGQEALGLGEDDGPVEDHRERVGQRTAQAALVPADMPDRHRHPAGELLLQAPEGRFLEFGEAGLVEKVHRRVAAERHLGEDYQFRRQGHGFIGRVKDPGRIPLEIPHDRVDLAKRKLHRCSVRRAPSVNLRPVRRHSTLRP
jgi:hypothetical protein